ncbi:MAG: DUF5596 domain-containing protein [Gemmatimonadetes bacterium]|nr:DUF5596 domain-containing protein [Gemmatimonadota bacterium]MBT7455901.1 DUF5596 domain-containing protein [Gemmatimonadota bacterium]
MTCLDVLTRLGIADAYEWLSPCWKDSPETVMPSLEPANFRVAREFSGLPESLDAPLQDVASQIIGSDDLRRLFRHCQGLIYDDLGFNVVDSRNWPQQVEILGEETSLFYLLVALGAIPRMQAIHQQMGIPEQVTRDTCTHFPAALERYRLRTGKLGVGPEALYWLRNHTTGSLFCLGRLEFMLKPFRGPLTAWRHRSSLRVIALATEGNDYDAEGLVAGEQITSDGWTSAFSESSDKVSGSPISPTGYAQRKGVDLPLDEWERVLSYGDLIYEVHIPEGGGMTRAAVKDSMQQATEFFPRHFPQQQAVAFACSSWILNPELEHVYHAESNMVRWQRELYLYPTWSGTRAGLHFIFGSGDFDLQTAPRDTSLRRALLDHVAADGRLIGGGMFLLLEDFEHYGEQVYRAKWPHTLDTLASA